MPSTVETVVTILSKELAQLMTSGENWQIVLHGGKSGDVVLEVKRTRKLLPTQKVRESVGTLVTR
jgi:hypothetical protein